MNRKRNVSIFIAYTLFSVIFLAFFSVIFDVSIVAPSYMIEKSYQILLAFDGYIFLGLLHRAIENK